VQLHATGTEFSHHIAEEISLLTGRSLFVLPSFQYQQRDSRVSFVLERFAVRDIRPRLFGALQLPTYETSDAIKTIVEIQQVEHCEVRRSSHAIEEARFHVERGISVARNSIHVSSVEEDKGEKFFLLTVRVKYLDIRLSDDREATFGVAGAGR
jgi:hypothetical protein